MALGDIYLTGNPQITFWKVVYRRHTNFARESIQQTFNGTVGYGNRVTATISRNGDLLSGLHLECDPSAVLGTRQDFAPNPLLSMIKSAEVQIGGQMIDKHYGHWLNVWFELTEDTHVTLLDDVSVAGTLRPVDMSSGGDTAQVVKAPTAFQRKIFRVKSHSVAVAEKYACVPLPFWFCRNPGLALPLIALQYHEVKLIMEFEVHGDVHSGTGSDGSLSGVELWGDYVYLDTDERRRFAQVSHEYLIEQLQHQEFSAASTFTLNFNHPVKELVITGSQTSRTLNGNGGKNTPSHPKDASGNKLALNSNRTTMKLQLNGHDRFAARPWGYFSRVQTHMHHPKSGGGCNADAIGVYSFALEPEEHQPSGTCNFSRIDTAKLVFSEAVRGTGDGNSGIHVYAVNYNVLRIMSRMGGARTLELNGLITKTIKYFFILFLNSFFIFLILLFALLFDINMRLCYFLKFFSYDYNIILNI